MEVHVYLEDFDIENPFERLVFELVLKYGENSHGHIPQWDKLLRCFQEIIGIGPRLVLRF